MPIPFITNNKTPYPTEALLFHDKSVATIVKGSFNFSADGTVYPAEEQKPIFYGDQYFGEPGKSSLMYASDMAPAKTGSDIALIGHAYAPDKVAHHVRTVLQVGDICKEVWVSGDRFWKWSIPGISRSRPLPFRKMPLVYERAFGGSDTSQKKAKKHGYCLKNPVGTGFVAKKNKKRIKGLKLPNLENRKNEIKNWKDRPAPGGYGFIAPNWQPRAGYADINAETSNLPDNFDTRFYNAASPGLLSETPLKATERVSLVNLHPEFGHVAFYLPAVGIKTTYIFEDRAYRAQAVPDTLVIEPDENLFTMVWRSRTPGAENFQKLRQVNVFEESV